MLSIFDMYISNTEFNMFCLGWKIYVSAQEKEALNIYQFDPTYVSCELAVGVNCFSTKYWF